MHSMPDRQPHHVVPGGMKLHLVAAMTIAVMRVQHRRMRVGERPALQRPGAPKLTAVSGEFARSPPRAFPLDRFPQRAIARK
jgi:hypothetical protein